MAYCKNTTNISEDLPESLIELLSAIVYTNWFYIMYVYIHIMYVYIYMCVCVCGCVCVCVCVCVYVCMYVCMYVYIYVCINKHTDVSAFCSFSLNKNTMD